MRRLHAAVAAVLMFAGVTANAQAAGEGDYAEGLAALAAGKYAAAVTAFGKAVDADEGNGSFLLGSGVAKVLAQDLNGATADLRRAVKMTDAQEWEAKGWLGVVNRMSGRFEQGFSPGMAPYADRTYAIAINDMGQNYGMSATRGTYYDKQLRRTVQTNRPYTGDFAGVARMFVERHRAASGAAGAAGLERVKEMMAKGEYAGALEEVRPLAAANPEDDGVQMAYGECLLGVGNVLEARTIFTRILTRTPEAAEAYQGRAKAAVAVGDTERAVKDLTMARELEPARAGEIAAQMEAVMKEGSTPEDPQAVFKELEGQAMKGTEGLDQTAMRLLKAVEGRRARYDERYQERRGELEMALKKEPQKPDRMVALGRFLFEESSVQGETVGPRSVEVLYRPQTEEMKGKEVARAEELADGAIGIDGQHVGAMALKAEILLEAKNFDDAETWTRKALAIKADDPNLLELLAKLLEVDASYKITAAGNLKQPKDLFETRFDEYPPVEYHWVIYPTADELRQAAQYEQQAQALSDLAMQTIEAAVKAGGRTPMGYYFDATTKQMTGDYAGAEEDIKQALALNPQFQKGLFLLAAVYTDEKKGDEAVRTRTLALNLSQTTDAPWVVAAWYKIPRGQVKGGRAALMEAAALNPADVRIWAYLAVLDEAEGELEAALAHWRMAQVIGDAILKLRGKDVVVGQGQVAMTPEEMGLPVMIRMRVGLLELKNGQTQEAVTDFSAAAGMLSAVDGEAAKEAVPSAMLPDPNLAAGVVPMAESVASMRIRAKAGKGYAAWAAESGKPQDAALAAETYRRMLVDYPLMTANMESLQAIADLGRAELYVHSGQLNEAKAAMSGTAAVPQDFWQEMRRVEGQVGR